MVCIVFIVVILLVSYRRRHRAFGIVFIHRRNNIRSFLAHAVRGRGSDGHYMRFGFMLRRNIYYRLQSIRIPCQRSAVERHIAGRLGVGQGFASKERTYRRILINVLQRIGHADFVGDYTVRIS